MTIICFSKWCKVTYIICVIVIFSSEDKLSVLFFLCKICAFWVIIGLWFVSFFFITATVPHSLSPYPSEEEEQYFHSFPQLGCPTPPRNLHMEHKGENSIVLSWGPSKILDTTCKEINKPFLGKFHFIAISWPDFLQYLLLSSSAFLH